MKLRKLIMMGLAASLIGTPGFADGHGKWSAFVDAQYNYMNTGSQGFVLNDGAFYYMAEMENGKAMIDVPFSLIGVGAAAAGSTQAYVAYKYDNGFSWTLGQWDSTYRRVALDSKDIFFARAGLVNGLLDATHTGLMVSYAFSESFSFNAQASNGGAGTTAAGNYDFGGQIMYNMNSVSFGLGYLYNDGNNDRLHSMLGFDAGHLGLGLDFLLSTPEAGDSAIGVGAQVLYETSDTCGLGLRFDFTSKANGFDSQIALTPGLKKMMTKDLTMKLDYTFMSNSPAAGDSVTAHQVNLAGVYNFN